jgi:hypothetical protein
MVRHGFNWDAEAAPYIDETGGVGELLESAPVTAKGRYERVGIVLDADVDIEARWSSLRNGLAPVGVVLPATPVLQGTIVQGIRPTSRVGVWLMPDNSAGGRLEEFLQRLVPVDDRCWDFARRATHEALTQGCNSTDEQKSAIHAWLAWQDPPGLPFGTALRARIFAHDAAEAIGFVAWFRRLFIE